MEFYTEAHPMGRPDLGALVVVSPNANTAERIQAFNQAEEIAKEKRVAAGVAGAVVFACHKGEPDPSLFPPETEQRDNSPTVFQTSVIILGTH